MVLGAPLEDGLGVFLGLTVVTAGFAAAMTGRGLATTWQPRWLVIFYCLLLGLAERFLAYALFEGNLLSLSAYLVDSVILCLIGMVSYQATRVGKLTTQYPWLYERAGPLTWREKSR